MKLRDPRSIRLAARLTAGLLRFHGATVRYSYRPLSGPSLEPAKLKRSSPRYVYMFRHEDLLRLLPKYGRQDLAVLIGRHADGELVAQVAERLGFRTVRGSTFGGAREALKGLLSLPRECHVAITPDGPRGPRRSIQPGGIFLAAKTGRPIVPWAFAYSNAKRLNSWDEFAVPLPFSRVFSVSGEPIVVPSRVSTAELECQTEIVHAGFAAVERQALAWAETGRWPTPALDEITLLRKAA